MRAYRKFASLYDSFMCDIPYGEWSEYVIGKFKKYGVMPPETMKNSGTDGLLLELGCGTGSMARYLCMEGYRVVGLDLSPDMVKEAKKKLIPGFEAHVWDMRTPFLEGEGCSGIVSVCDSMNYLTGKDDIRLTMKAAAMQLRKGGVFIFDMKTDRFYREELGDNVFADHSGRDAYIWENHYDGEKHINTYDITFYHRVFGRLCTSFTERHVQRAFSPRQVCRTAGEYGLHLCEYEVRDERAYYIFDKIS